MAQMRVFVSHSHEDDAFCRAVVEGLRGAGADVWYDEHNMGSGQLIDTIERELRARPIFVLVLSPAALQSQWVRDETTWAYLRYKRDPTRIMLPVLAEALPDEDDIWMFMQNFKRIEAAGLKPYPTDEAISRLLHTLALTPANEAPTPTAPQPSESAAELLERGKALKAQQRYAEALPLFQRASQLDPRSPDAWANLGDVLDDLGRYEEALTAYDSAIGLDSKWSWVWNLKGVTLRNLKRYEEALAACDSGLALDPNNAAAWNNKGVALSALNRSEEALAAYDRALDIDPNFALAAGNRAFPLRAMGRIAEAEAAVRRAKELDG